MYSVKPSSRFRKDLKLVEKRAYDVSLLTEAIKLLATGKPLPEKYRDHELKGQWFGYRECHIISDWLLIYRVDRDILMLTLARTGTHADLFQK